MNRPCCDEELLPISALQHLIFCDRQAALIHLERIWLDNPLTVEGKDLHRVVDSLAADDRGGLRVRRGIALRSERLGLTGKADVVEFHPTSGGSAGVSLPGEKGSWRIVPVEYKRGRPKSHRADEVQLCAQGMCLEEVFGTEVYEGFLFYARTRRREKVRLTEELRGLTERTATSLHALIASGRTPMRQRERKCDSCSLLPVCLPPGRNRPRSVAKYLDAAFSEASTVPEDP